ncbi:M56 family metallopeptidase [Anaerovorax sp. IOR16]|uniref:M56 family metallopeptidase n=1 Tax=Anaerovorax sp. IOR16 TaxID=2773458 RepID=UPI0019D22B47|nr:M56 family metallopeptidase [Anaerovorax sp. IOR16]
MTNIFMTVVNMSITATFAALIIFVFRSIFGKKIPKLFSYALWGIVLLRLVLPFSFSSVFSILDKVNPNVGQYGETLSQTYLTPNLDNGALSQQGIEETQAILGNTLENAVRGGESVSEGLAQGNYIIIGCTVIWIIGVAALLAYSIISYLKITRRVSTATRLKNKELIESCNAIVKLRWPFEVYVSDQIESPFVCGILRSKIILPSFLFLKEDYEKELQHILLHEMVHIKRFDFILKPLAYIALIIHWFNPVMWFWFYLASKDMEMSCDEKVIKISRLDQRESYANTLLEISMKQNNLFAEGLLGFGESNIGERVKNIMKYKKPKMWVIAASILIIAIFGIVLLSNPMDDSESNNEIISVLFMGACEADSGENTPVDSFVLMGYEASTGNLNILSIPRDTVIKDETRDTKLGNYAALHSPEQVIQALNNILGVNISKYIKIDTAAFRDFIDAIGGISYDVPQDMYYDDPMQGLHIDLKKGLQVLDGNKAEMLVRFRKGYSEGDITRIDVQKEVLVAILTQKSGTDIFKNIGSLYDLVSNNIETNIDKKEIKKYSAIARKHSIQMEDIKEINLPFSVTLEDRISYIRIDEEEAQKVLKDEF